MSEQRKPIFACLVALDFGDNWQISEADKPFIQSIRSIFFYDKNERTHLCEFTPSYYLVFLNHTVILTEAGEALSESAKDTLYQRYEFEEQDNPYYHCHDIDAFEERAKGKHGEKGRWHKYGRTGVSYKDSDRDSQIEGLREHFQGNSYL